ncbi:hypothetical protein ACH429_05670 [Streptomyces pathocidini]|uniref:Uncharacterized protein n=1 Tax=Streptomyces pathocidini TaxID=1650571 RepID=A0ABW7UQ71_9ACTN|nr:hypothetical protein [Streptomyces pathocidini]
MTSFSTRASAADSPLGAFGAGSDFGGAEGLAVRDGVGAALVRSAGEADRCEGIAEGRSSARVREGVALGDFERPEERLAGAPDSCSLGVPDGAPCVSGVGRSLARTRSAESPLLPVV